MNKFLLLVSFVVLGAFASGCSNTLDGAGRDISRAGDAIQKTF